MAASSTARWSVTVLAPGIAGPQPGCAGGVREAQHQVEPEPPLVGRRRARLVLRVHVHQREVGRGSPGGGDTRPAPLTWARTSAIASHRPSSVAGVICGKVRYSVESDGTAPNRAGWARGASMSEQASPPPASINMAWVATLAPIVARQPFLGPAESGPTTCPRPPTSRGTRPAREAPHGPRPRRRPPRSSSASYCYRSPVRAFPSDISMCRNTENALLEGSCRVLTTSRHLMTRERSGLASPTGIHPIYLARLSGMSSAVLCQTNGIGYRSGS
jgi:hypothetical protein